MNKKKTIAIVLLMVVAVITVVSTLLLEKSEKENKLEGENSSRYTENDSQAVVNQAGSNQEVVDKKNDNETHNIDETANTENKLYTKAESIIQNMSVEEKACQLFIVTPEALTGYDVVTLAGDATKNALEKYPVAGLIYFDKNLVDKEQTKTMLSNTQKYAYEIENMPLFLTIDEEGGSVARIANNSSFNVKNVGNMSDVKDADTAYEAGCTIGTYLSELGFNWDFAPDADVLTNPMNNVIGKRSFGSDAKHVSECAEMYSMGLNHKGILSTYKHFPGHGATEGDTHEGFAYTDKTYEELVENELIPFCTTQADSVMVAHISLPSILGDNTPCTLSYKMMTEILRDELGYEGLVITDAFNMGAITEYYDNNAVVTSFMAGADIILMPENFEEALKNMVEAINSGEVTEDKLNESLHRIIEKKMEMMEK